MATYYTNIPIQQSQNSDGDTLQTFDAYYDQPLELKSSTFNAIKGFFESRGFDKVSAESLAVTIIRQSKIDNANPMTVLDSFKSLESVEISAMVSEILNYNRFKTSFLGYSQDFNPTEEVARNVLA